MIPALHELLQQSSAMLFYLGAAFTPEAGLYLDVQEPAITAIMANRQWDVLVVDEQRPSLRARLRRAAGGRGQDRGPRHPGSARKAARPRAPDPRLGVNPNVTRWGEERSSLWSVVASVSFLRVPQETDRVTAKSSPVPILVAGSDKDSDKDRDKDCGLLGPRLYPRPDPCPDPRRWFGQG